MRKQIREWLFWILALVLYTPKELRERRRGRDCEESVMHALKCAQKYRQRKLEEIETRHKAKQDEPIEEVGQKIDN
jgi:hypothetical protein